MRYVNILAFLACWIIVIHGKSTTNLAIRRPAWQSTTFDDSQYRNIPYYANKSVDGNKDTDIENGGCSSTKSEDNSWWVVGLHGEYCITTVKITWRNTASHQQNGVFLAVGTRFDGKQFMKKFFYQCVKVQGAMDSGSKNFDCSGIKGSFVSLYRSDAKAHIQMCEVEVYGYKGICAVNLALRKQVQQSSTFGLSTRSGASNAVDGNKDTDYNQRSCSHTSNAMTPPAIWWVVFLDQEYHITKVTITWRNLHADFVNGAEILIGSRFKESKPERRGFDKCADISGLPHANAPQSSFNCQQRRGSSVLIYNSTPSRSLRSVILCEVEVFGFEGPEQAIQDGRIYQFNYEALVHSEAAQKCWNRKRTLLSSVHVEQRDIKPYISAQMVRLGLNQSWISTTGFSGTQCSYMLNNTTISMTACDDRYGYVCISEPKEPFVISLRRYSIYTTNVNFSYAQETCNSKNQAIIKQSDIMNTRKELKKHGLESIWIVSEKIGVNISTGQCVSYNVNSDSGPMYSNCTDTHAFVCGEDQPTPPTTVASTATKATGSTQDKETQGRTQDKETQGLIIALILLVILCVVTAAVFVIIYFVRQRKMRQTQTGKTDHDNDGFGGAVNLYKDSERSPPTNHVTQNEKKQQKGASNSDTNGEAQGARAHAASPAKPMKESQQPHENKKKTLPSNSSPQEKSKPPLAPKSSAGKKTSSEDSEKSPTSAGQAASAANENPYYNFTPIQHENKGATQSPANMGGTVYENLPLK